jgi:hypothetical protein
MPEGHSQGDEAELVIGGFLEVAFVWCGLWRTLSIWKAASEALLVMTYDVRHVCL